MTGTTGGGTTNGRDGAVPVLDALGVGWEDEQLYRCMLGRPPATTADLASATGWDVSRVRRHLRSLDALGLVARTPTRPARFAPAVPDAAIEVLALQRQAAIEQARIDAAVLAREFRAADRGTSSFTVVRGQEAIAQRFFQAQLTARREVMILDKPPYAVAEPERQGELQLDQLRNGISYRTVYDADALADAEQLAAARELARGGERSRMLRGVPLKMVITDGRAALLRSGEEIVELGPSALLDGLVVLFELLWRRATPLWESTNSRNGTEHSLTADDEQLLALAAAGLTDQAIARRLGVAQRTVERRMQRIMRTLDATTRFQAGLRAAQRGILTG